MKKSLFKIVSILIALFLVFSFTGCSSKTTDQNTENVFLTFGGGNASTEPYTYWVSVTNAMQTVYPELKITTVDAQGGVDISQRVRAGTLDAGNGVTNIDYDNYYGTGSFDGKGGFEDHRLLWYYDDRPIHFAVAASTGITYVNELDGLKFNPGGTGTASGELVINACDLLGIKPNWFEAGNADATEAFMSRQTDGSARNGSIPESQIIQMQSARDITILKFTQEEIDKILEKYPSVTSTIIPAGSYKNQNEDILTISTCQGGVATPKVSQEVGYKMINAMMSEEGRAIWTAAYPKGANIDVIQLTLNAAKIPLHAGTVQYMKEQGIDVPAELIPPEYKE